MPRKVTKLPPRILSYPKALYELVRSCAYLSINWAKAWAQPLMLIHNNPFEKSFPPTQENQQGQGTLVVIWKACHFWMWREMRGTMMPTEFLGLVHASSSGPPAAPRTWGETRRRKVWTGPVTWKEFKPTQCPVIIRKKWDSTLSRHREDTSFLSHWTLIAEDRRWEEPWVLVVFWSLEASELQELWYDTWRVLFASGHVVVKHLGFGIWPT